MDVVLECIGPAEADACVNFLISKGIDDVAQYGNTVHAGIAIRSVYRLADDAVDFHWATKDAAAQLLADMSNTVDTARAKGLAIR